MINPAFFSRSLEGRCYTVTDFWREWQKLAYVPHLHILCAGSDVRQSTFSKYFHHGVYLTTTENLLCRFSENTVVPKRMRGRKGHSVTLWFRRPSIDIFEIFSPWRSFNHNRKPAMPILWKYSSPKTNEGQKRAFCYRVCLRLCRANYRWALPRISSV